MYTYLNTSTNRELSKLLYDKGCVSESEKYWAEWNDGWNLNILSAADYEHSKKFEGRSKGGLIPKSIYPAFTFEDCIRRENAIKIWGDTLDICKWCHSTDIVFYDETPNSYGYCSRCSKAYMKKFTTWEEYNYKLLDLYQSGGDWQTYIINHLKGEKNV